jgi:hypothetical protein
MPKRSFPIALPVLLLLAGCGEYYVPPENPGPPPPISQIKDDDMHPPPGPTDPYMIRTDDRAMGAWADYCTRIKDMAGPKVPPSTEKTRIEGDLRTCEEIFAQ